MSNEPKVIKIIQSIMCPHCNKEALVAVRMTAPVTEWALKREDIQMAKEKVITAISESSLSVEEKKTSLDWVQNEETLFGPEEVENLLKQILKISDEEIKNKK